ncbi:hypothetical protein JW930_00470 [Candidatus Woesearchaeota archaeon]|nr:hypothetical protein [Candidatus Woesearchaeota archaeon]
MKRKRRDEQKIKIVIAVVTIIFLLSSSIILFNTSTDDEITINGTKFRGENDYYVAKINGNNVRFYSLPYEASYLNISKAILEKISNSKMVILTFDPDQEDLMYIDFIRFELAEELAKKNIYPITGITKESSIYQLPVFTCKNASSYTPVIEFFSSNKTNIFMNQSCIHIEGKGPELVLIRDKLIYGIYGLI